MFQITEDFYQFSRLQPEGDRSDHAYLLLTSRPVLAYPGNVADAQAFLPEMEALLGDRQPAYCLIPCFRGDQVGGLAPLLQRWPRMMLVCTRHVARQLRELGLSCGIHGVTPGERITGDDFDFSFLPEDFAPEEPLIPYEAVRGILFSGDYFCQAGDSTGRPFPLQWKRIVRFVGLRQIPQRQRLHRLRQQLLGQKPNLAAPAHGRVLRCL